MRTTIRVEGLRQLEQALSQFKPAKRRAIGRTALDSGGQILAKAARAKAPVDTGGLRESIDVSGTLTPSQKAEHRKASDQERFVGPDGRPEAHLREFGGDDAPPHPYMRPAWDETNKEVLDRIGDELWLGIEKEAKAAARKAGRGK